MITERANIIRQNRKSIKILITENGEINIYAPKHISNSDIEKLVGNKESWAIKKSQKQKENQSRFENLIKYESVLICGKEYIIKFEKTKSIGIFAPYIIVPAKYQEISKLKTALKKWFKSLAEELLTKRAMQLSYECNYAISGIKIGDFRAKWGSCDTNKLIKLNYKLTMIPHKLIDAVILHELVHTKEMNHSDKFYKLLIKLMPDYKKVRAELKNYGYLLKMY